MSISLYEYIITCTVVHSYCVLYRDLQKYEKKLLKRRQTAEELLQYKEELLKKERDLKTEEHNINKLIEEAIKTNDNTSLLTNSTSTSIQRTPVVQRGGDESEGVTEEILTTAYTSGSFDTDRSTPLTSTPHTDGERRGEEGKNILNTHVLNLLFL